MNMLKRKIKNNFEELLSNPKILSWGQFFIESIVSVIIGLAIGYVMSDKFFQTAITIIILIVPLLIFGIILIVYEHRMSLIAILNKEIKNRRYENAIMLGLQISEMLFHTKQNANRVRIGKKVQEAIKKCDRELNNIVIGGKHRSKQYVSVMLNLDDLGWSLYQADKEDWNEAVETIRKGTREAEIESIRLFENSKQNESQEFLKMTLKGYRHLAGIFLDRDIAQMNDAILNENKIKLILSRGTIIHMKGVCIERNEKKCRTQSCPHSNDNDKMNCIKNNITNMFEATTASIDTLSDLDIWKYINNVEESTLGFSQTEQVYRLRQSIKIYASLSEEARSKIVKEYYYAFARNNIKKIRINSNIEEKHRIVNEAIAYANTYVGTEIGLNSKEGIRYDSLMNEIQLEEVDAETINSVIDKLNETIKKCTTRTDLCFRNSALLITAYPLQHKFLVKDNTNLSKERKLVKIKDCESSISDVVSSIKKIDRQPDMEFEKSVKLAKDYLKKEKRELKRK
ncbi:MAG: hypothetical protein LBV74_00600 [Tannerella sp.]|jgi:F0F1-type ATP synthase assembly protein I|nr:hypothetical protein [Tannerella sp.]